MDIGNGRDSDTAIVAAIMAMARSLNLNVIAEGVETVAQLQFLRDQGCTQFQGLLASGALPADEVTALLQRSGHSLI